MTIDSRRVVFLVLMAAVGCARQSPYVAPATVDIDPTTLDESMLIPYRTLVQGDFKADYPPRGFDVRNAAAATVAMLRTTGGLISAEPVSAGDSTFFVATVDSFQFEARMSLNDSWWNPKHKGLTTDRMLQHEQTHFALWEIGARQANAHIGEIMSRIRATAKTEVEAMSLASKRFREEHARVQAAIMARNAQFDMETANGQKQEKDDAWFARIERELELTEPDI